MRSSPAFTGDKVIGAILFERTMDGEAGGKPVPQALADKGMRISGRSPDGKFVEIAELPSHPWFVAVQFHPEFKSKPLEPHPLFVSFIGAALRQRRHRLAQKNAPLLPEAGE